MNNKRNNTIAAIVVAILIALALATGVAKADSPNAGGAKVSKIKQLKVENRNLRREVRTLKAQVSKLQAAPVKPVVEVGSLYAFGVNPVDGQVGYVQINPAEGAQWFLDGLPVSAGKHEFPAGIQTDVYAVALPGYKVNPAQVGSIEHPFYIQVNPSPTSARLFGCQRTGC